MREILFRSKRVDNGEWIYGDLLQTKYNDGRIYCDMIEQTPTAGICKVTPSTVGQYTGLTDKNGNKIFEGDIVQCYGGERCQGYWEYNDKLTIDMSNPQTMMFLNETENKKIIGNIHDNPELLEELNKWK